MTTPYRPKQDMEELVRQFRKYRRILAGVVLIVILLVVFKTSFYSVEAESQGVVLRFGKHVATTDPGLHFKLPWPITVVYDVPVKTIQTLEFGFHTVEAGRVTRYAPLTDEMRTVARLLTGDTNLAHVEWIIQYRIKDPFQYLFHIGGGRHADENVAELIRDIAESVMRRLVGDRSVDEVITTGRDEVAVEAKSLTQELLDQYESGISVVTVKLQSATPPEPVKDSFDSVNRARQNKEKTVNMARGERNRQVPAARGRRDREIAEAEGYRERTVRVAQGRANAFLSKLAEYEKAPEATRARLYFETMEQVLSSVDEVVVIDESVRGVLPLLNLDTGNPLSTNTKGGRP